MFLRYLHCCPDFLFMLRLISNFVTSQTGHQITTIHILPSFLGSKSNQALKCGKLIKLNVRNIFLQKSCKNEAGRLVPDLFLFFKKLYIR